MGMKHQARPGDTVQVGGSEHTAPGRSSLLGKCSDTDSWCSAAQRAPVNKRFFHVQSQWASTPRWPCDRVKGRVKMGPQRTQKPGRASSLRNVVGERPRHLPSCGQVLWILKYEKLRDILALLIYVKDKGQGKLLCPVKETCVGSFSGCLWARSLKSAGVEVSPAPIFKLGLGKSPGCLSYP